MTPEVALEALRAAADPAKAAGMAAYHKAPRVYLGCAMPAVNEMTAAWRRSLTLDERLALAAALWDSNVHEARVAAAKLLTQARIRPDDGVWRLFASWVPQFDGWAVADHARSAGQRRVMADLARLDPVEAWTSSDHLWTKRAALVVTLPLARLNHLSEAQQTGCARVLDWAAGYVPDQRWFIQKAVAWWLRDLSKHDPDRTRAFLDRHGAAMKPFARKEAGKYLA